MQTKPNQNAPVDPEFLDAVLHAFLDEDATYPAIAANLGLSVADLLDFIERSEVQESLVRLRNALLLRAEIVALSAETAAMQNLASVGKDLEEIETERRAIEERAKQVKPEDKSAQAELDRARKLNDKRCKDRIESARSARSTLSYARKPKGRADSAVPRALRLALPLGS